MANEFKVKHGLVVHGNTALSGTLNSTGIIYAKSFSTSGSNVGTPEMYGAAGDGVVDDFLAFKHALISHSIVELDAKTYAVRGWIGMPSNRSLVGKGKDRTVLKLMGNSPYGYSGQLYVIQNTVLQDDVHWTGSVVGTTGGTGSILVDYRDTTVRDESPSSPYYHQSQAQAWAGMGYWGYDDSVPKIGGRRNVLIEGLTIDCNFENQARHASYNHSDNPFSASRVVGGTYYIPSYANRVRPTIHAVVMSGENITLRDLKVINYGYGVDAAAAGPLDYANGATLPPYNENFPLLLNGDAYLNHTSSDYDIGSDAVGLSRFRGNYAIGCEVLDIASTDLMNPFSNTTAIYVTNQSVVNATGRSNFTSEGGIFDCIVDPGERIKTPSASFWSGSYLDGFSSSSLKQTAGTLAEWLYTSQGALTGSNGDIAISFGSPAGAVTAHMKKISGSWYPVGGGYNIQEHAVQGFSGYRMSRCLARNLEIGFYLDSWRNNAFLDNNQMIDVSSGFRYVVSDISLTSSYKNVIVKDNYIKLSPHERAYVPGHGVINYALDISNGSGSSLRHIDNLVIEDNIFELPVSSSRNVYNAGNFLFQEYPRYVGFYLSSEVSPSGSTSRLHRAVSIKNNKFFNWKPPVTPFTSAGEAYGYSLPFYFTFSTGSFGMDAGDPAAGPYPLSVTKFKNQVLPNYIIEGNTYSEATYPSTSSLVPLTIQITGTGTNYFYPIDQVSRFTTVTVNTGSVKVLFATGSLHGTSSVAISSSYASTSSYALNGGSSSGGSNFWNSGSISIQLDESGSLQDEDGNPISEEGTGSIIYYTGNVSIGTSASAAGYSLYVSRSIKISGELSQGTGSIPLGNWSHAEGDLTYAGGIAAHAEGYSTNSSGSYSHAEGGLTHASGIYAHAEGSYTSASNYAAHAEGYNTVASGQQSHAEGYSVLASGGGSHAEGRLTTASGISSHAEGSASLSVGVGSHAEGADTLASGISSHAEGYKSVSSGWFSHCEGNRTTASGQGAHSEGEGSVASGTSAIGTGYYTIASGDVSHTEGNRTTGSGPGAHAEGDSSVASGNYAHSEGYGSIASGIVSHAEGVLTIASAAGSHAEGRFTTASAEYSHAEGVHTMASADASHVEGSGSLAGGMGSHAEGNNSSASGQFSHAEGFYNFASGYASHAEGVETRAVGTYSHAEGSYTVASGQGSHAEGNQTSASGASSHTEGFGTLASALYSHAEGRYTTASGNYSHAEGEGTISSGQSQHVSGKFNVASSDTNNLFIIGNGTSDSARSNVLIVTTSSINPSGFITPPSSSNVGAGSQVTGSMFYSGSNLFIFTGNGNAGGLTGWKTASLGG